MKGPVVGAATLHMRMTHDGITPRRSYVHMLSGEIRGPAMLPSDASDKLPVSIMLHSRHCHVHSSWHVWLIHPEGDALKSCTLNFVQSGAVPWPQRVENNLADSVECCDFSRDAVHQEHRARVSDHLHAALAHLLHGCGHAIDKASPFILIAGDPNSHALVHDEPLRVSCDLVLLMSMPLKISAVVVQVGPGRKECGPRVRTLQRGT